MCCVYVIYPSGIPVSVFLSFLSHTPAPYFSLFASPDIWRGTDGDCGPVGQARGSKGDRIFVTPGARWRVQRVASCPLSPLTCTQVGDPVRSEPLGLFISYQALLSFAYCETFSVSGYITDLRPCFPRVCFSHCWAKVVWATLSSRYTITTPDSNYLTQTMLIHESGRVWLHRLKCSKVNQVFLCLVILQ